MATIETINLDDIKMENPYLRLGTDVSTLEKSIETIGLIAPLIVNTDNILLAGARRWQALKNLGHTECPVIRVEKDSLHQELLSIDENLVRKALNSTEMEQHLLRAKEIYRELAQKDEMFKETLIQKRRLRMEQASDGEFEGAEAPEELDVETLATEEFANEVSLKSGLSQRQIIKAMEREEKSTPSLKDARKRGEISVSQANEIIRLTPEEQEEILPYVSDRTVSELKKIVKDVKSSGVAEAIERSQSQPHAREFNELLKVMKKSFKITEALKLEGVHIQGPVRQDMLKFWHELKNNMEEILDEDSVFTPEYLGQEASSSQESTAPMN